MAIAKHPDARVMGASFLPVVTSPVPLGTLTAIFLAGGYEFLMENCTSIGNHSACSRTESLILVMVLDHTEDKICIFGFSRGAYTARALAGMVHKGCAPHIMSGSSLTRSVTGGPAPRGEPPASSLCV
jgi:hypothetical protein